MPSRDRPFRPAIGVPFVHRRRISKANRQLRGRRAVGTYEVFLKDVVVPADRVIGGEGGGWDCLMGGLQFERAVSSAGNCGGSQAIFDLARKYAAERVQFGQPIGSSRPSATCSPTWRRRSRPDKC